MPIIPLYLLDPVDANDAILLSAFNFCNPFDDVLPFSTGTVSALDRQHLWGLYIGIPAAEPSIDLPTEVPHSRILFRPAENRLLSRPGEDRTLFRPQEGRNK